MQELWWNVYTYVLWSEVRQRGVVMKLEDEKLCQGDS